MNWYKPLKISMPRIEPKTPGIPADAFDRPANYIGNIPLRDFAENFVGPLLGKVYPEVPNMDKYTADIFGNISRMMSGLDKRRSNDSFYEIGPKVKRITDKAVQEYGGPKFKPLLEDLVLVLGEYYKNEAPRRSIVKRPNSEEFLDDISPTKKPSSVELPPMEKRKKPLPPSSSRPLSDFDFSRSSFNWKSFLKIADDMAGYKRRRKPYSGPPRYFGPMRLINFVGNPAIIGNTMKLDRNTITQMGFKWQGNTQIDGTQLGDAPDNVINGAMIGVRELTPEEIDLLTQSGVDTSMAATVFEPFIVPAMQPPQEEIGEVGTPDEGITYAADKGAQTDRANTEMLIKLRSASNKDDVDAVVQDQLAKLIDLMNNPNLSGEQLKLREDFIKFMSSGHKYSFNNMILMFMQRRDVEKVGSEKGYWNANGRQLNPGENPMWISAPIMKGLPRNQYFAKLNDKMRNGKTREQAKKELENEKRVIGWKDVPVYDVSQTVPIEGWTHPETGEPPFDVEGLHDSYKNKFNEPDEYADTLWGAVIGAMESQGIDVGQEATGQAGGWSAGGKVRINEESMGQRRVATLFHEYAHEVLHTSEEGRKARMQEQTPTKLIEAEAESTAWLLMQHFGLEGDPEWAARYMLLWNASPQEVMERQNNIQKAFKVIREQVTRQMDDMLGGDPGLTTVAPTAPMSPVASNWYTRIKVSFHDITQQRIGETLKRIYEVAQNKGLEDTDCEGVIHWARNKMNAGHDTDSVFMKALDDINNIISGENQ